MNTEYLYAEYGELKWEIAVGPKKRGNWRPEVILRFFNTKTEKNILNINTKIPPLLIFGIENCPSGDCGVCRRETRKAIEELSGEVPNFYDKPKRGTGRMLAEQCLFYFGNKRIEAYEETKFRFYMPWKPGKPDYSEEVAWLQVYICEPVISEYKRRLEEAYKSLPMDGYTVTSDDIHHQVALKKAEEHVKKCARRIKI